MFDAIMYGITSMMPTLSIQSTVFDQSAQSVEKKSAVFVIHDF